LNDGNIRRDAGERSHPYTGGPLPGRVSGEIEAVEGVLKIVRIIVDYTLKIADDKRAAAERAFDGYITHCPAATSVMGCIDIKHTLDVEKHVE
jgi:cell fate regulator YaaT (PSP1 superfamily)